MLLALTHLTYRTPTVADLHLVVLLELRLALLVGHERGESDDVVTLEHLGQLEVANRVVIVQVGKVYEHIDGVVIDKPRAMGILHEKLLELVTLERALVIRVYPAEPVCQPTLAVHLHPLLEVLKGELELVHRHAVVVDQHHRGALLGLHCRQPLEEVSCWPHGLGEHLQILRKLPPLHHRGGLPRLHWHAREVRLTYLGELRLRHRQLNPLVAEGVAQRAAHC
mmetsp:Transcript_55453/g.110152  ORF Transcript_55453/g.110152 Transcript_55453/m.110152 type:complete len:224 (+) Transcript_55453:945-1616(+)